MEERHKAILRRNRINLVRMLDPADLDGCLLEKGIFTKDMIDEILRTGTRRDQARKLVQNLETRGSRAFPLFLEILQEKGQQRLSELLRNGAPPVHLQPLTPTTQFVRPVVQPLPISSPMDVPEQIIDVARVYPVQRYNTTPSPSPEREFMAPGSRINERRDSYPCYKMDASPCGHCLIINNEDFEPQSELKSRPGSSVDCDKMENRFKAFNFIVKVKKNLKQHEIKRELSLLSKTDHSKYDCCVVIILSHGTEVSHNCFPGAVHGVDGTFVPVQLITNYLNGRNCLTLQGKPKLFFIQACGGDEKDIGFEVPAEKAEWSSGGAEDQMDAMPSSSSSDSLSMSDEPDARTSLPTPSDILVSYSTSPGYVSWRDPKTGSWYIDILDRVLEENAHAIDLARMLTMVNSDVSDNSAKGLYKQMPGSFNFLRKLLYFEAKEKKQNSACTA